MYNQSANLTKEEAQDFRILAAVRDKSARTLAGDVLRGFITENRGEIPRASRRVALTNKLKENTHGGRRTKAGIAAE